MSQDKIRSTFDEYTLDGDTAVFFSAYQRGAGERFNLVSLRNRIENLEANPGHGGRAHDTSLERQALKELERKLAP